MRRPPGMREPTLEGQSADSTSALVLRELQAMRLQMDTLTRRLDELAPAAATGGGGGGGGGNGVPVVQKI